VAEVMERQLHRYHAESFSLKNVNKVEDKMKYPVEVLNRLAALIDLEVDVEIISAWEMIKKQYQNFCQRESRLL
jgi:hypothetical protein